MDVKRILSHLIKYPNRIDDRFNHFQLVWIGILDFFQMLME